MVATIAPAVHGGSRSGWARAIAMHAAGSTLSASLLGASLGGLGGWLGAPWGAGAAWVVVFAAALYAAHAAFGVRVFVPALRHQVPEWWRTFFSSGVSAALYGVALGVGFLTYQAYGTLSVVGLAAVASGHPLTGAALLAPFGLVRGLTPLVGRRARSGQDADRLAERLAATARTRIPALMNASALAGVSALALVDGLHRDHVDVARLALAALAVTFAVAAASKVGSLRAWRRSLGAFGLPAAVHAVAFVAVPAAESMVVALAVAGARRAAAWLAVVLLTAFSSAVLWARRRAGGRLPCGCFGRPERTHDVRWLLARNLALIGLAVLAIVGGTHGTPWAGVRGPTRDDAIAVVLVACGVILLAWTAASTVRSLRVGGRR